MKIYLENKETREQFEISLYNLLGIKEEDKKIGNLL